MKIINIKPYARNAKKHPDAQLKQIALSLKEYGWRQPIVVDKNDTIIVGHGRYAAYQKYPEGIKEPWIIKADDLTPEQVRGYRLMDNKTNESDWDEVLALEELKGLSNAGFDLELTGFSREFFDGKVLADEIDELARERDIDLGKYSVLTVEAPEAPRLKARMSFYFDDIESFNRVKEFFKAKGGGIRYREIIRVIMRYFSLFTGIGGLDYGIRDSECVGFSDVKKSSVEIYKKHYPRHVNYGDITEMDFSKIGDFDLLTGGFPCQSFSMAGARRGLDEGKDKKGAMVLYIYRLLLVKQPKYFVLENVKGILNHEKGQTYEKVFRLFENAGYYVRVVLLNALYYGSAQNRERVLFLGSKKKFDVEKPLIIDESKRFRDVYEEHGDYEYPKDTERNQNKIEQLLQFNFELIGKWDRVGILTTQYGCGEKLVSEGKKFRYLTPLECERLQGFPDGWTEGVSNSARYFALGNAVNCKVSEYLFKDYLPRIWNMV